MISEFFLDVFPAEGMSWSGWNEKKLILEQKLFVIWNPSTSETRSDGWRESPITVDGQTIESKISIPELRNPMKGSQATRAGACLLREVEFTISNPYECIEPRLLNESPTTRKMTEIPTPVQEAGSAL